MNSESRVLSTGTVRNEHRDLEDLNAIDPFRFAVPSEVFTAVAMRLLVPERRLTLALGWVVGTAAQA